MAAHRHAQGPWPCSPAQGRDAGGKKVSAPPASPSAEPQKLSHGGGHKAIPQALSEGYMAVGKRGTSASQSTSPAAPSHTSCQPRCVRCQALPGLPARPPAPHLRPASPPCTVGKPPGIPRKLGPVWMGRSVLQNAPFIKSFWRITNQSKNNYHFLAEEMKLQSQ